MSTASQVAAFVVVWVAIGLTAAGVLSRRGHEFRPHAALGAVLGPVFIFLAYDTIRRRESTEPLWISPSPTSVGSQASLVVAVGSIPSSSPTAQMMASLSGTTDVYAAVPTTYEEAERVSRHGVQPAELTDLEQLALLLQTHEPGLLLLPGPLEKSVPAAVDATGATAVVLVGEDSSLVAPGLEDELTAKVVRVDDSDS